MGNDQLANGFPPTIPNGSRYSPPDGSRTVHDGFATIRAGGGKRGRARSSPSVAASADQRSKTCPACCGPQGAGQGGSVMEPLWEDSNSAISDPKMSVVTRRDPKVPWWEVATRRSKYRSCPAFSQANIVSALEQTVSDVTDRLERLASSPDLKATEVEELRRSAAVLRRQSSAVSQSVSSGYFSLERQASCDSVSSVSSSISNVTHLSFGSVAPRIPPHQHLHMDHNNTEDLIHPAPHAAPGDASKHKKRNWLRASFRRAFGKQKRKRGTLTEEQSVSPNRDDTLLRNHHNHISLVGPNRYSNCNSMHRERYHTHQFSEMCKEHRSRLASLSNVSEHQERLQNLLQEKEKCLIESKAELISAQSQLQKQNELIAKLQSESAALKEENLQLRLLVENKFGSVPEPNLDLDPLLKDLDTFTISGPPQAIYATVQRKGKKIKILVRENLSLENSSSVANLPSEGSNTIFAGCVVILPKTTWEELDNSIAETFEDYCSRLDPGGGLGLGRESLLCYKLAEAVRAEGLPKPDLLPYGYCVGNVDGLHLWLKGPLQKSPESPHGSLASVAFQNGLPAPVLQNLLNLLNETKRIMLVGPSASGKTTIAKQLARGFVTSRGTAPNDRSIVYFTVTGNNGLDLCQVLSSIWPLGRSTLMTTKVNASTESIFDSSSGVPEVLVIDDIHAGSGVVETLQRCLPLSTQTSPVVIATSTNVPSIVTRLQVHCYFRWVGFSIQEEPVRGLLGRILRKPLLAAEDTSGLSLPMVHRTVEWLTRLWLHLNSFISSCGADSPLGPALLADCPMDQEEARLWFTWKWNEILAPKCREVLKTSISTHNWTDPKEWIVSTYPWTKDASALSQIQSVKVEKDKEASPTFRMNFSQRMVQSSSVKPQVRVLDSPSLPRARGDDSKKKSDSVKSSPTEAKKPTLTETLLPFSTFLKSSVERDLSKINIDSFTPLLYRRDRNMNRDINGFVSKHEKSTFEHILKDNQEKKEQNILHSELLKEVSL